MSLIRGSQTILNRATTYVNNVAFWEDELEVDITNVKLRLQNYDINELTTDIKPQVLNLLATASPLFFDTDQDIIDHYDSNRDLLELMFLLEEFLSTVWTNVLNKFVDILGSTEENLVYTHPRKSNSIVQRERVVVVLFLKDPSLLINVQLYQVAYNRGFRQIDLSNLSDTQKDQLHSVDDSVQETIAQQIRNEFSGIRGKVRYIDRLELGNEILFFFKSEYRRSSMTKIDEVDFVTEADWFILQLDTVKEEMRLASSGARIGKNYLELLYQNLFPHEDLEIKELTPCYEIDFVKNFVETVIRNEHIIFSGIRIIGDRFGQPYIQIDEIENPILSIFDNLVSENYISLDDITKIHYIRLKYEKTIFTLYIAKCYGDDDKISIELSTRNTREDLLSFEEFLSDNYSIIPIQGRGDYIKTRSRYNEDEDNE